MTRTETCLPLSYFRSRPPFMHSIAPSPQRRLTEFPSQSCPRPPPTPSSCVLLSSTSTPFPLQMPIVKLENHALALAEQQARERDADAVSDDSVSVDSVASSCSSSSPALSPFSAGHHQVGIKLRSRANELNLARSQSELDTVAVFSLEQLARRLCRERERETETDGRVVIVSGLSGPEIRNGRWQIGRRDRTGR